MQLPEGIDDLLGAGAQRFELYRRKLLDLYAKNGFELVIPPVVEYAGDISSNTFKFPDSISDRTLEIHADVTMQIARIDNKYNKDKVKKYCYINSILKTRADDFYSTRCPIQAGAEIYGDESISVDIEIINLMLESLKLLSIDSVVLSLGNVAIFNAITDDEKISDKQLSKLRQIFARRSTPDLNVFLQNNTVKNADKFTKLIQLEGTKEILNQALEIFKDIPKASKAILDLLKISEKLKGVNIIYDLAELKTYEYHNGIIFAAYNQNYSKAISQGGRYQINRSRTASGFSFDLKFLSQTANL